MTLSVLTNPQSFPVAFGISVAPVTDWSVNCHSKIFRALYDSVYTERYMQTPTENPAGYNSSSIMNRLGNMNQNSALLLMHGTADDNVHFQNTAELAAALIQKNIQFETMFYPDKDHSISGSARIFLYEKMTHFLKSQI